MRSVILYLLIALFQLTACSSRESSQTPLAAYESSTHAATNTGASGVTSDANAPTPSLSTISCGSNASNLWPSAAFSGTYSNAHGANVTMQQNTDGGVMFQYGSIVNYGLFINSNTVAFNSLGYPMIAKFFLYQGKAMIYQQTTSSPNNGEYYTLNDTWNIASGAPTLGFSYSVSQIAGLYKGANNAQYRIGQTNSQILITLVSGSSSNSSTSDSVISYGDFITPTAFTYIDNTGISVVGTVVGNKITLTSQNMTASGYGQYSQPYDELTLISPSSAAFSCSVQKIAGLYGSGLVIRQAGRWVTLAQGNNVDFGQFINPTTISFNEMAMFPMIAKVKDGNFVCYQRNMTNGAYTIPSCAISTFSGP